MKRMIKNPIFMFILGAVLFSSITGVAAATFLASDISYTPKDTNWNVNNVKDAIDELYVKANANDCIAGSFKCTTCNTNDGQEVLNFKPSRFILYDINSDSFVHIYDSSLSTTNKYFLAAGNSSLYSDDWSGNYSMNNNLKVKNIDSRYVDRTLYYYACK